jgi:hypothetical protein
MQMVYANVAGIRGGPFDVSLEFGYLVPQGSKEEAVPPAWLVRVGMSWEHLRALHQLIGDQLASYEEQVGSIREIERTGRADT